MNDIMKYINEYALILIPFLYIVGMILKSSKVSDKYIPLIITAIGIIASMALNGLSPDSVIQGVLVSGVTVYTNQLLIQSKKEE